LGRTSAHRRTAALALSLACLPLLAGCGSSASEQEQDKNEPSGEFQVRLIEAEFPLDQKLAKDSTMMIAVENAGTERVPNINVTVKCRGPLAGREVAITGGIDPLSLADVGDQLESIDGTVVDEVTDETDYLVVGTDPDEALVAAAEEFDVEQIDPERLQDLLEQSNGLGGSFNTVVTESDVADPERPQFVVNQIPTRTPRKAPPLDPAPLERSSALVDTYPLGPLEPGAKARFRWDVTAVKAGSFRLCWRVNAGLYGKAEAVPASDSPPLHGEFEGEVSNEAPAARIADDGKTVIEEEPDADR
jgi:hypothetical protein